MSRAHERANAAAWALSVSAAGAVLLVVLPSLGMIAPDPAGSAALAVLALAFAMLVQSEIRCLLGALAAHAPLWPPRAASRHRCCPDESLIRSTTRSARVLLD